MGSSTVTSCVRCNTFAVASRSRLGSTTFTLWMGDAFTVLIGKLSFLDGPRSPSGISHVHFLETVCLVGEILMYECKTSINPANKCKYVVCILNLFGRELEM